MKFTYDTPETETRECVAYIDGDEILVMRDNTDCIYIDKDGDVGPWDWNPTQATHKFYRGDSVTITF